MRRNLLLGILSLAASTLNAAPGVETVFQPVALTGQSAPGLNSNVRFSGFDDLSLADDGRIAFTANVSGPGISSTNQLGIWGGLPGELRLLVRTGAPVPGETNGDTFSYFWGPNLDNHQAVGFVATTAHCTNCEAKAGLAWVVTNGPPEQFPVKIPKPAIVAKPEIGPLHWLPDSLLGFVVNALGGRVELFGPAIGPTNNVAIVAGSPTNVVIVARKGSPAAGATGNFTFITDTPGLVALMPNGKVAFVASTTAESGVWLGNGDNVEGVALSGRPAPVSLLGAGYTFVLPFGLPGSDSLEVNGRGELAFSTSLNGPGLNGTNSDFVVAGTPAALRVIAQNGQPAPGIPGAFFRRFDGGSSAFSHVLLGADGAVVFVGCYSATGTDFGLWLAPTNGATPLLLMRSGQQAPGTPAGVMFSDASIYVPPFRQAFMNARNQVVFRARLGGPGIGTFSFGIWLAEADGTVSLVARVGDMIDTGGGILRQLDSVTFGIDPVFMAGPEDGRRSPFNDRGDVALSANFTDGTGGVFVAQTGINLSAERAGNDIRVRFPTLAGKTYRVDHKTNLTDTAWSVFAASVNGTGNQVTVTNASAASTSSSGFYRVARTD